MDKKERVYLFKISLDKKIYREMELLGSSSLYKFAETIVSAFNFELDHSFGFYSNKPAVKIPNIIVLFTTVAFTSGAVVMVLLLYALEISKAGN